MALTKKGSRLITVDGTTYRWRVRHKPTYAQGLCWTPLTYAVEAAGGEGPGTTLVVTTDRTHPGNWLLVDPGSVRPEHVADAIREARERGWDPARQGSPFPLDRSAAFRSPH
ncbi:hypothetical protein ACPCKV_23545 [Streptomyces koyangensis]|uniref:hypothetical protein n=1 Tax=Streptomyces koyangensis TaxID=188770 RepID=UPI003C2CEC98